MDFYLYLVYISILSSVNLDKFIPNVRGGINSTHPNLLMWLLFLPGFHSDIVWWRFFYIYSWIFYLSVLSEFLIDMAGSISKDSEVQIFREDQVKINTFAKKNHKLQVS